MITQILSLLQSVALAVLALAGVITVPRVLLLQIALGMINAFDTSARQAFVSEMVEDRADLPNAIALNSSMVNASRIMGMPYAPIGSLIAGVAADRSGPQRTILFGGLSCIAAGTWFASSLPRLREMVRPIYVERGILAAAPVDATIESL